MLNIHNYKEIDAVSRKEMKHKVISQELYISFRILSSIRG